MTREAYKFLQSRLNRLACMTSSSMKQAYVPPEVIASKKIIKNYEHQQYLEEKKEREAFERERDKVREIIHAGDYDLALQAVKAFEKARR